MILFTFLALVSAPFLAVCSASPLEERADDTFNIYAFGEGISGLQLYSEDGMPHCLEDERKWTVLY